METRALLGSRCCSPTRRFRVDRCRAANCDGKLKMTGMKASRQARRWRSDHHAIMKVGRWTLPESALMEGAYHLQLATGEGIPLADYADSVEAVFSELADAFGWEISAA